MRSLIRNIAKKTTVQDFNDRAADIIRDVILGESKEGKRLGRSFAENGMKIYDVEVLDVEIGDEEISEMLVRNQHDIVENNLEMLKITKELEFAKVSEDISRQKLDETLKTHSKQTEVDLLKEANSNKVVTTKFQNTKALEAAKVTAENELQEVIDMIVSSKLAREKRLEDLKLSYEKERSTIQIQEVEAHMAAIQPGLIEAMIASNDVNLAEILAKNLKEQKTGLNLGDIFGKSGGFEGLLETVKGTPLFDRLQAINEDYKKLKASSKSKS
jgi:major vault protein